MNLRPLFDKSVCQPRADVESGGGTKVLFRPFSGVAPRLYKRAFLKDRDLKDEQTGNMQISSPEWLSPWHLAKMSYLDIEAKLTGKSADNAE